MDREYFARVEQTFLQHAGGLMLAPADARLIAEWSRAGIPIDIVEAGIAAGFERDRSRPVRRLGDVRIDVERALARWQERRVGQRPAAEAHDSLGVVFEQLAAQFAARADDPDPVVGQLVREATAGLHAMARLAREAAIPDPVEVLDSLAVQLGRSALRHASEAVALELGAATSPERLWREVRARYQLPPLVIDVGGGW